MAVTMREFFAHVEQFDYDIEEETDRVNGCSYDNYVDRKTGKEVGFISYMMGEDPTHTIRN